MKKQLVILLGLTIFVLNAEDQEGVMAQFNTNQKKPVKVKVITDWPDNEPAQQKEQLKEFEAHECTCEMCCSADDEETQRIVKKKSSRFNKFPKDSFMRELCLENPDCDDCAALSDLRYLARSFNCTFFIEQEDSAKNIIQRRVESVGQKKSPEESDEEVELLFDYFKEINESTQNKFQGLKKELEEMEGGFYHP